LYAILRPPPFHDPQRLIWLANSDVAGLSGQTTQVGHMNLKTAVEAQATEHFLQQEYLPRWPLSLIG